MFRLLNHLRPLMSAILVLACAAACVADASAADIDVTAEFQPNAHDPNSRTFTNTTPWSGVCSGAHNATCRSRGIWSIDTTIRGTKSTTPGGTVRNDRFYFGMPSPRTITVQNARGETHDLRVRIQGMAFRIQGYSAHGGRGMTNCSVVLNNVGAANQTNMRLFLRNDDGEGNSACWSQTALTAGADREIHALDVVYVLETSNPLGMSSGTYTGSTTYSIGGAGSEIDLGDGVNLTDESLTINFTLDVDHAFELNFPEGSDRVVLSPVGGWSQWTDYGKVPSALRKELPFQISTSGRVGIRLSCEFPIGNQCGVRSQQDGKEVPVAVAVTMPGLIHTGTGAPAVEYPLNSRTGNNVPVFAVDTYVIHRPSRLLFEVGSQGVAEMVKQPGSHWRGDVTVIFDAEP